MSVLAEAKQMLMQSSVGSVVRAMRNMPKDKTEAQFMEEAIREVKTEIASKNNLVKSRAVEKLTYFSMLGYSGEYGAFHIIELMADNNNFGNKRIGYVAASCVLTESSDVLPLCTALLKKDMGSPSPQIVCLALYCLSCICTSDLARDLVSDVVNLLSHQRPVVRKKAILCLYKIFLQFPEALRPTFPKLKAKIEDGTDQSDSDPTVRGAVVNIFCELVRRNAQNFLNLVPPFFSLVTSLHNNWTLIKVIKLLGCFVPHEPRLGKKLVEPLTGLITSSGAKSVQYECLYAVVSGMRGVPALLKLAVEKLNPFVTSRDPNLRMLGLDAMTHVIGDHPKMLVDLRESLVDSLTHNDPGIRSKALILYSGLATKRNFVETINKMFDVVQAFADDEWSNHVIKMIIETIRRNDYENVNDFNFIIFCLKDLAEQFGSQLSSFQHGALIESELVVILTRVPETRPVGIEQLAGMMHNTTLLGCAQAAAAKSRAAATTTSGKHAAATIDPIDEVSQWHVLKAAAFLCGEFPQWVPDKKTFMTDCMSEKVTHALPELQATAVSAALKMFLFVQAPQPRHCEVICDDDEDEIAFPGGGDPLSMAAEARTELKTEMLSLLLTEKTTEKNGTVVVPKSGLFVFSRSVHTDVQERALLAEFTIRNIELHSAGATELTKVEVEAIIPDAQEHVAIPEGVDLTRPFADDLPALIGLNERGEEIETSSDDDTSDDDDDVGADSSAGARAAEEQRKAFAAAQADKDHKEKNKHFIIQGDDAPVSSSGAAAESGDADSPGGSQSPGSPTGGSRHAYATKKSGGAKMKAPISKPSTYVDRSGNSPTQQDDDVDEATKAFRNVKVTGPLTKDDAAAVAPAKAYERVDATALAAASAAPSSNAENVAAIETKRITASANYSPIELFDATSEVAQQMIQVEIQFCESKIKKDGTVVISAIATIQNTSSAHSVYNVGLTVNAADTSAAAAAEEGSVVPLPAALPPQLTDGNGISVKSLTLCDKTKQQTNVKSEFSLLLENMGSLAPINVEISFKMHKVERTVATTVQMPVKLFMAHESAAVTSDAFNTTVLPTRLATAGCLSATLPCPSGKTDLSGVVKKICNKVGVNLVDTFKSSATLCGMTLHRKSHANDAYVALLLNVTPSAETEGENEVTLVAKCNSTVVAEALLTEAAELIVSQ